MKIPIQPTKNDKKSRVKILRLHFISGQAFGPKGALRPRAKGALRPNRLVFTHFKNIPLDQISALYVDPGSKGPFGPREPFRLRGPFRPTGRSSRIVKICLWTKFQLSMWILAPTGPVFAFRPLNKLPL